MSEHSANQSGATEQPAGVRYSVAASTATLTLDSPRRRNALSAAMLAELTAGFAAAEADDAVRAVVLTHTGTVFCSGMDLTAVADVPADKQPIVAFPALLQRLWQSPLPVIARLNGKARAGGVGLVAAADLAFGVPAADFAFTEVRLGLVPAVISVPALPRLDPRGLLELCLTGETFSAERAVELRLLNAVLADTDALDAEVGRYTAMLGLAEPAALAGTKAMLRRDRSGVSMAEDFAAMSQLSAGYFASPAAQEGFAAFAAKRPPSWAAQA